MALIELAEFKTTLGVGNLYPDAQLQGVMDAAEDVILSMLQQYAYAVDRLCCTTANTIKMRTTDAARPVRRPDRDPVRSRPRPIQRHRHRRDPHRRRTSSR